MNKSVYAVVDGNLLPVVLTAYRTGEASVVSDVGDCVVFTTTDIEVTSYAVGVACVDGYHDLS